MKKRNSAFGETKRSFLDNIITAVRFRKIGKLIPNKCQILDLGCGHEGELFRAVAERIQKGVGVDLSVTGDKSKIAKNCKLITGKVDEKLPFEDSSFDVVTALAIIEHVDDPGIMLSEIFRVLSPGGKLLITTPSLAGKGPLEIMAKMGIISREEIADHKRYYTQVSLTQALTKAGFNNVEVKHFGLIWMNLLGTGSK